MAASRSTNKRRGTSLAHGGPGSKELVVRGIGRYGERVAAIYSLIGTAKLNGIDPEAYLRDGLSRIADHPINHIDKLLPWNLAAESAENSSLTA